ncbi:MAG TPA: CPBP family intramembrane glutamic endopeptidase, partial [Candidatus Krumholzibacteria bacterium]|nr:CPBP family intramembrane glutamic endopeptidase [Candidatus Krumholzibacteria bacterium]
PDEVNARLPLAVLALLGGPSVAGVLLTVVTDGRAGLLELMARLRRGRVATRWYVVALAVAPLLAASLLLALSLHSRVFLPAFLATEDARHLITSGLVIAVGAGVFEEVGWTGFAIPRLRRRHGVLATGLMVGFAWAVWHVLPAYWMSSMVHGPLALTSYVLDPFLFLLPFRVLMVWVYDHTHSVLVAMLMHTSLTATARIVTPTLAGANLIAFDLAWTVAMWVIVAVALRGRARGR